MSTAVTVAAIPTTFARRTTTLFPANTEAGLFYRLYLNLNGRVVVTCKDRDGRGRQREATVDLSLVKGALGGIVGNRHLQAGLHTIPLTEREHDVILGWG